METESKREREKKGREKWRGGLKKRWTINKNTYEGLKDYTFI